MQGYNVGISQRLQFGIVCFCSSIVSEDGASVYSASPEAATELPSLETSLRGAGKEKIYLFPASLVFKMTTTNKPKLVRVHFYESKSHRKVNIHGASSPKEEKSNAKNDF